MFEQICYYSSKGSRGVLSTRHTELHVTHTPVSRDSRQPGEIAILGHPASRDSRWGKAVVLEPSLLKEQ